MERHKLRIVFGIHVLDQGIELEMLRGNMKTLSRDQRECRLRQSRASLPAIRLLGREEQ